MAAPDDPILGVVNDTEMQALCIRMQSFARAILKAHDLGIEQGSYDEPWSLRYQREAADIYFDSTPAGYQANIAKVFVACADHLATNPSPPELVDDWFIVTSYLRSASTAINEHLEALGLDDDGLARRPFKNPTAPEIIRFDLIAGLCSTQGARRLDEAASALLGHFDSDATVLNEQETTLLRGVATGTATVDLAMEHGYSERSMYRILKDIYKKLGVSSRTEAIRKAAANGWLD